MILRIDDLATFVQTRDSLHAVAEHVVAKARYVDDGEIRLTAFPGGFSTPLLSGGHRVRVIETDIAVDDTGAVRRSPLTTVAAAAKFVGVEPGFPTELYEPATVLEPDAALHVDASAAAALATWYEFTASVLRQFAAELEDATPSELILWPEHFDQAFYTEDDDERRRSNYGASAGDGGHPEPYLYVGPWNPQPPGDFWNAAHFNRAVLSLSALHVSADPLAEALSFLHRGRTLLIDGSRHG